MVTKGNAEKLIRKYMPDIKSGLPYGFWWDLEECSEKWGERRKSYVLTYKGFISSEMKWKQSKSI
jgi:hypothetical protein